MTIVLRQDQQKMADKHITLPLTDEITEELHIGDRVLLSGTVYTARDEAHMFLCRMLDNNEELPFDLKGAVIYYSGPCPAPPGAVIGPAGPTTSGRMDVYSPRLRDIGVKGMIGKGKRSKEVRDSIVKNKAVYFGAVGGAGALLANCIKECEVIAFPELGAEAVHRLRVEDFPCTVVNDCHGGDLYEEGIKANKKL